MSKIIPTRGIWLDFETDAKNALYARIDRTRKVPLAIVFRALGLSSNEDILKMFDNFRYDLTKVGRYKFNQRLNLVDRLVGNILLEDVVLLVK